MSEASLYGKPPEAKMAEEGYESPEEYADQGDERTVRDLMFGYLVEYEDANGNKTQEPMNVPRGTVVTTDQIGLVALEQGETNHSFYTSDELEAIEGGGSEAAPVSGDANISELGEYELAEWLASENPETGRQWTINEVLEKVGDDKELAHRMMQAENIRDSDHPRAGLETGLQAIIAG
ncbi:MAG: hypothetical protein ABWY20_07915 [Mycobacterium sp.]